MKKNFILWLSILCFTSIVKADDVDLTIYNQNFYLAKESRSIFLNNRGINDIKIANIPPGIEESSVKFISLTDPSAKVIEQNFRYDLVDEAKIWYKFLNKKIELKMVDGSIYEGYLIGGPKCILSWKYDYTYYGTKSSRKKTYNYTIGNLLLAPDLDKGPITSISAKDVKEFPELPEDFVTMPALFWQLYTAKPGKHKIDLSYISSGMEWCCDYNAIIDEDDKKIDLSAWVTIDNRSGMKYEDAKVSLVAGDVHKVKEEPIYAGGSMVVTRGGREEVPKEQFLEQPIFEYHQYDLQRKTTLFDNETKQIELLNTPSINVKKLYYYDGARFRQRNYMDSRDQSYYEAPCNKKINVFLQFENTKANNLGIPLPFGKLRVYKKDKTGTQRFIGEDVIKHTPKDEQVKIYMGNAFDIVGERIKTEFQKVNEDVFPDGTKNISRYIYDESFRITLKNHKPNKVEIIVFEKLYRWTDWRIVESLYNYNEKDARTIEFPVTVPSNGETIITYTVRYWW